MLVFFITNLRHARPSSAVDGACGGRSCQRLVGRPLELEARPLVVLVFIFASLVCCPARGPIPGRPPGASGPIPPARRSARAFACPPVRPCAAVPFLRLH